MRNDGCKWKTIRHSITILFLIVFHFRLYLLMSRSKWSFEPYARIPHLGIVLPQYRLLLGLEQPYLFDDLSYHFLERQFLRIEHPIDLRQIK